MKKRFRERLIGGAVYSKAGRKRLPEEPFTPRPLKRKKRLLGRYKVDLRENDDLTLGGSTVGLWKGIPRWGIWGAQAEQNRTKIDVKNENEKRSSPRPSWSRLGPILGRFGSRLGTQKTPETLENVLFREHSLF